MAYIARGIVDCFQQEYLQPWDVAAGTVIIREAGGSVVNMKGTITRKKNSNSF